MDKDFKTAEIASRIQACFCLSDDGKTHELYTKIMNQVYDLHQENTRYTSTPPTTRQLSSSTGQNFI